MKIKQKNTTEKTKKQSKGITLIALVITIIVLLILAGVIIATLTMDNGLLHKATIAKQTNENAIVEEQIKLVCSEYQIKKYTADNMNNESDYIKNNLDTILGEGSIANVTKSFGTFMITFSDNRIYTYNISKGTILELTNKTNISKTDKKEDSYVGYYADINADGEVDGVIFADLLTGSIKETQEYGDNGYGKYTISKIGSDNLKNYYINRENYEGAFGTNDVLCPKGYGEDRFYIMSLTNFSTKNPTYTSFYWYKNAYGKINSSDTSNSFGAGKTNTNTIISKWNKKIYGPQEDQDIWKNIQAQVDEGWFIASKGEWAAFGNELGIINRSDYGLGEYYWTSSLISAVNPWSIRFGINSNGANMNYNLGLKNSLKVRLSATI